MINLIWFYGKATKHGEGGVGLCCNFYKILDTKLKECKMSEQLEEWNKLLFNAIVYDPFKVLKNTGHPFALPNLKRNDLNSLVY